MNNAIVDVRNVSITINTFQGPLRVIRNQDISLYPCLLYTSDAADE